MPVSNNAEYDPLNLISVNPAVPPKWLIGCLRDCVRSFDAALLAQRPLWPLIQAS